MTLTWDAAGKPRPPQRSDDRSSPGRPRAGSQTHAGRRSSTGPARSGAIQSDGCGAIGQRARSRWSDVVICHHKARNAVST